MASPELGDRDVFGVKVGASGAIVQVFLVRGGRVIERVEFVGRRRAKGGETRGRSRRIETAIEQFYGDQEPPPEIHVPVPRRAAVARRLARPKGRPQGPHRRAAARRQEGHDGAGASQRVAGYRTRFDRTPPRTTTRSSRLQAALRLPKLPRRIDCFDISTIQGSETVASMVVCEEDECSRPVPQIQDQGREFPASSPQVPPSPKSSACDVP